MKAANRLFTTLLTVERKAPLRILTNLRGVMGNICNCLTHLLIKQRIKREIIHLLHKSTDDGSSSYMDNKRCDEIKKSNYCCTGYVK